MSIELPDFVQFEPFNRLRNEMNAVNLGSFELFNPDFHLTGDERSALARKGIGVAKSSLHHLLDFSLVYKNSRVLVIDKKLFHLASCETLPDQAIYLVATSLVGEQSLTVCPDCLKRLQYKGYDPVKARREAYSRQILDDFRLSEYKSKYPFYPVSEKRELRKQIH